MTKIGKNALIADENKSITKHINDKIEGIKNKIEILAITLPYEEKTLGFMKEEFELKKIVKDLITENSEKITPDFKYETYPEYIEYAKKKQRIVTERYMYDTEMEIMTKEKKIENLKQTIEEQEALIVHHNEELKRYGDE